MIRKAALILVFASSIVASARHAAGDGQPTDAISVQIVPETFRQDRRYIGRQLFHVVVTNNSAATIRLWKEWCSWGYFNLSFEARGQDGKTKRITSAPRPWGKNYPDWIAVPPGEHFVIDVSFQGPRWTAEPGPMPGPQQTARLRAIYEIPADKDAKADGVWTGRVSSAEREYTLY